MERQSSERGEESPALDIAPDGVDLGLIRWMLSLTPLERLDVLQDFVDGALALRDGRVQE